MATTGLSSCRQGSKSTADTVNTETSNPVKNVKNQKTLSNYSESQLKEADTLKVPMSMVRNVKQARNGDILIASYLGVFRYDGTSFTNLTSKISSPRFSSFWDVLEDRKGNLWFASKVWALSRYDQKSLYNKEPTVTEIKSQSGMLLGILEDAKGNIWFGSGGGVYRYDGKTITDFKSKEGQQ